MDLSEIVKDLRRQGSDNAGVEVKAAAGGFPENTASTFSAFANTPGGGMVVFGIDEANGFAPVPVYDVAECQKAASNVARSALEPPIAVTAEVVPFEGTDAVVVYVPEADRTVKPVRVTKTGKAYVRLYDGDYPLSGAEEQILIAQRGQPRDDDRTVDEADGDDLDRAAVAAYIDRRRASSRRFQGMSDETVLIRTGVLAKDGARPTLAGLLALGVYPQQYFPSLAVQANLVDETAAARAIDTEYVTGPIPAMIDGCVSWVARVTPTAIVSDAATGAVRDLPTFPPIAVRELVANALIHRDLSPASVNQPITLRVTRGQGLLLANPGGLYAISVEGLGKGPSSLRNARLTEILQFVHDERGDRVVERLGSGIPETEQALLDAGLPPLRFDDRGIRFTVFVDEAPAGGGWTGVSLAASGLLQRLSDGPATIPQLAAASGRSPHQVRYLIRQLLASGHVTRRALDGRTNLYSLAG
jgi:ATP-dependent DNA helicase RecG